MQAPDLNLRTEQEDVSVEGIGDSLLVGFESLFLHKKSLFRRVGNFQKNGRNFSRLSGSNLHDFG
jgi:hypothetical protein